MDFDEKEGIKLGEDYRQVLYKKIKESQVVLLVLTQAWVDSKWCFAEYQQAHNLGKTIIPIIAEEGIENKADEWIDRYYQKADLINDNKAIEKLVNRIKEISQESEMSSKWNEARSPYPGLYSFEESDAKIFFGREVETGSVIEKLNAMRMHNDPKLLNIVAASGMGKSSLLKASVLPHIKSVYSNEWHVLTTIRPTKSPLSILAQLLAGAVNREHESQKIYQSLKEEGYREVLDTLYGQIISSSSHKAILLPIDQAEEFYSIADPIEREYFLRSLSYLCDEKSQFYTIWTLRADYIKYLQKDKVMVDLLEMMQIYSLTPLKKESVNKIIKGPASLVGFAVEDELIEKLKEDIKSTDALPLLAMTLKELYKKAKTAKVMTLNDYKSLAVGKENPLEYIIKEEADKTISSFRGDNKAMKALKEAFIPRIIGYDPQKNEYFKKVALYEELPERSYKILEELVKARLMIKTNEDGKESIEVAHEALLREWPLLAGWLEEEQEFLIGKSQLDIDLKEWNNSVSKEKAYSSGIRLKKAASWLIDYPNRLTEKEQDYIRKSIKYDNKLESRKKLFVRSIFLIVLVLGIYGWNQSREAEKNLETAEERLKTIKYQKSDTLANLWVMLLVDDVLQDGHINRVAALQKVLGYLDENDAKKDYAIDILYQFFRERGGIKVEFPERQFNNFDELYTKLVFEDKETALKLSSLLPRYLWLLDKSQIDMLNSLLNILLSENVPVIFQKYKSMSEEDRKKLEYVSLMLMYVNDPAPDKLAKMQQYKQFKNNGEGLNVFSGLDSLLHYQKTFKYVKGHNSFTKEFTKEEWENLLLHALDKVQNVSRMLYWDTYTNPSYYTKSEISLIKDSYFNGIFEINMETNTSKETSIYLPVNSKNKITGLYNEWRVNDIHRELDRILSVQKDNYWALNAKLQMYFVENEKDKYMKLIDRMIELFPTQKKYLLSKSKVYDIVWNNETDVNWTEEENKLAFDHCRWLASYNSSKKQFDSAVFLLEKSLKDTRGVSKEDIASQYGNLSWYKLFISDYEGAIRDAKDGLELSPSKKWILTNMAHGYLFSGEIEKAKKIYYENKEMSIQSVGEKWEKVILQDFDVFRKHNMESPHFQEIEKRMQQRLANDKTGKRRSNQ